MPAHAQELRVTPLLDARLSAEHIEQEGLTQGNSEALTLRLRPGLEASVDEWRVLLQAVGTVALVDNYYDGLHGAADRPLIADPETISIYRAQVQYREGPLAVTIGRQRISLDEDRFVDASAVRQNGVSYDGVRLEWAAGGLRTDLSYIWNVRTVWGEDGYGARPADISGSSVFVNLGHATPLGELTAYAYIAEQDELLFFNRALSSQTYGLRLAGDQSSGETLRVNYVFSAAQQSDYAANPNDYAAHFYLADIALDISSFQLGVGYDVSGADAGAPLTSFQYPYGSGFRYRGNAGKFQIIPPDGLHDLYFRVAHRLQPTPFFDSARVQATYHDFSSDRDARPYGSELDLSVTAQRGQYAFVLRYSDYATDGFATDTQKLALQVEWTF
jgi:hypothetical protein